MATSVKITTIGNSVGIVLPKEILTRLQVEKGDRLYVTQLRWSSTVSLQGRVAHKIEYLHRLCEKTAMFQEARRVMNEPIWMISRKSSSSTRCNYQNMAAPMASATRLFLTQRSPSRAMSLPTPNPGLASTCSLLRLWNRRNHAFIDGNKRTALVVSEGFLLLMV